MPLSSAKAEEIYNIVRKADILNLPSDDEIENWGRGRDGITYTIEYSDEIKYSIKSYWSPYSQKNIPVGIKISKFIDIISDTLQLEKNYTKFWDDLPKRHGYYDNRYGTATYHHFNSTLFAGYSGATKLPLGFYTSYFTSYIGKKELNLGFWTQYNFDTRGFYHLNFSTVKGVIFYKQENLRDYVYYNYQNRKLDIEHSDNQFQNHLFRYGLRYKNFGIGAGVDCLIADNQKTGGHLFVSKWFSKPQVNIEVFSSVFANQINYKVDVERPIRLGDKSPIPYISLGLTYEEFMDYKDLYFRVLMRFY